MSITLWRETDEGDHGDRDHGDSPLILKALYSLNAFLDILRQTDIDLRSKMHTLGQL